MDATFITSENLKTQTSSDKKLLKFAAGLWFVIAALGQWMFAFYVIAFYGRATAAGNIAKWNEVMPHGFISGDLAGNLVVGVHLLLAAIIIICGPLQIIPQIRNYAPTFHRFCGRLYIFTAIILSSSGLIMVWTRGSVGGMSSHISISINAILIIVSAISAIRYAMEQDFKTHRIWALRLFLSVNGVWFFRVGLMFWLLINGGPVGFDPKTFEGPFLSILGFSQYIIPLIVLELYLRAKTGSNKTFSLVTAAILFIFTVITAIGVFAATMGMWLPRL
jgi:hypothetical protein